MARAAPTVHSQNMQPSPAREPSPRRADFDGWLHPACPLVIPEPIAAADTWSGWGIVETCAAVISLVALTAASVTALICAYLADPHATGEPSDMENLWLLFVELVIVVQFVWRDAIAKTNAARGLVGPADYIGRLSHHARALGDRSVRPVGWLWAHRAFWCIALACSVPLVPKLGSEPPHTPGAIPVLTWALVVSACALRGYVVIRYMQLDWLVRRSLPSGSQRRVSSSV
jgi:hypothetical protein